MADQQTAGAPPDLDTIKQAYAAVHAGEEQTQGREALPEGYSPAPEGEAGEHGEPVTEQAEQPPPIDLQTIQGAYRQVHPPSPIEQVVQGSMGRMLQFDETVLKRLGIDVTAGAAGLAGQAAAIANLTQAPNLQGLSVDQVSAVRDQMVKQKADADAQLSRLLDTGIPDDAGIRTLAIQASSLDERIKQADGIISSGQATFEQSPTTSPIGGALRSFAQRAVPREQAALDQLFPTDQDFVNSPAGQIATMGSDALYLAGTGAVGVGVPAAVGLFGSQAYQDAKQNGASDETAERASLMTGLVTAPTMTALGPLVGGLAESFAGLTPKEGIQQIIKTATHIVGAGGEMSTFQLEQNAIAKLSGYDPDRKLDEGTWQAFWTGIGWGSISQALNQSPRLARLNQPDVTVRNKAGTPAETGPQTPTEVQPAAQQITPGPLEEAQAAAQAATAAPTAERVLTQQGTPQQQLAAFNARLQGMLPVTETPVPAAPVAEGATTAPVEARVPAAVGGAEPVTGREETPEALEARRAQISQQIEAQLRPQPVAPGPTQAGEISPTAVAEAVRPEAFGRLSLAQQNAVGELVRRGMSTDEAINRVSLARSDNFQDILREITQQAAVPWWQQELPSRTGESTQTRMARGAADEIRQGQLGSSVFLSDIANRLGISTDEVRGWAQQAAARGEVTLDVGHWPSATEEQRAAAVPVDTPRGRENRLMVRFPEPELESRGTELRPEPRETPVTPTDVKREVNLAQEQMGMQDHLHYVPNVEALPDHVKAGLTVGERGNTAQIVHDNKLGDIYVIGDRFSGLQELRRAIIEETQPSVYRRVTDLRVEHNPNRRDLGWYDPVSDRPTINTHALLRSANPYAEASRSAMEEVNVHQGISRLVGRRNAQTYVDAMNSVQRQFDRLGLNDILAQKKGYANMEEMAKDYGYSDYAGNPRSQHKLTEELIGAYSRTFRNPAELEANGPPWYKNALRALNNGIRRSLGLKLADYDVQSLLADSAGALRRPKWQQEGQFHPEIDAQAKADMADFQFRNRAPEGQEKAAIGTELVKAKAGELAAGLRPGEIIREQPWKMAFDQSRDFRERMNLLSRQTAIDNYEGHKAVMQAANEIYNRDFSGNPNTAINSILEWQKTAPPDARNPALVEVTNRNTTDFIRDLRARGFADQATLMEAKLDRFNVETVARSTSVGRELSAERLRHMDGQAAAGEFKDDINKIQERQFSKRPNRKAQEAADKGLDEVKQATKDAAGTLQTETKPITKSAEELAKAGVIRPSTTKSLPEQYTEDLVKRIDENLNRAGPVAPANRAPLEDVYNTFRRNIQEVVKEQAEPPSRPKGPAPNPMDTLRSVMQNYPSYEEAWRRTVDQLQTSHPELYQALDRALAEPVGDRLANRLATQHGQNLSDLVYNHFSTVDRITEDLGSKIAGATGLDPALSAQLANHLQDRFRQIVQQDQSAKLDQILKAVGGTRTPPVGELDRLVNHIALGSLNRSEWLNTVAPRFGIKDYTPETIRQLKIAGDKMLQLREDGLSNSAIAQKIRADIGDLTRLNAEPKVIEAFRYLNDIYSAGLLTGPLTHLPYWVQNIMQGAWDSTVQGIRTSVKIGDPSELARMLPMAVAGYARGMEEFRPILGGIRGAEEFLPTAKEGAQMLHRGPMEKAPIEAGQPLTWLNSYKYVRNFLDAVSNLMLRGPEYAILHANAMSMVWDNGMRGDVAWQRASDITLGDAEDQQRAREDAQEFAGKYNLNEHQTTMLENELLDKYKTESDLPPGAEHDAETGRLRDIGKRAFDLSLQTTLRGDVPGMAGLISRGLLDFTSKMPGFRPVAEFLKVPFNAINQFMAWTPVGFYRSLPDLVRPNIFGGLGGIESYLRHSSPEMEAKFKAGEPLLGEEAIRDLAWSQASKALVGSIVGSAGLFYIRSMFGNPNPPVRFTYQGPSNYGQQEIERGKGWQPRSVYFGGAWHSYENTPWRMLFAGLGAYEDYSRYEKQNPDGISNQAAAALRVVTGAATSAFGSPLQGLDAVLQAATQMQGGGEGMRAISNFLTQSAASIITTPLGGTATRQIYRLFDPTEYEASSFGAKLLRYTPVVNSMFLEPKLNVFGEPMHATPLKNFPEYGEQVPTQEKDPVWNYLATHPDIKLSMPGNQGSVGKVKMSPEEIYQYHLARGPYLKEELARAFSSPSFNSLDADRQNAIVKRYEEAASKVGKGAVYRYREAHLNLLSSQAVQ
jgi:hypothetical protein